MLKVQEFLRGHRKVGDALKALEKKYSIRSTLHHDGRVILNYSQLDSNKFSPIVQECRGLVLNRLNDWALVARAFPRFFNLGESREDDNKFDWCSCLATEKCDGSLLIVYNFNKTWHVNTRGSFGDGKINTHDITWRGLFEAAAGRNVYDRLDPAYTYIFELCSKYNQVVRYYNEPTVFLLTAFRGEAECPFSFCQSYYDNGTFKAPKLYQINHPDQCAALIAELSVQDATWEGIVVRDKFNHRLKVKSARYVELHKLASNGGIATDKSLVGVILQNEKDEVLTYWPELRQRLYKLENDILDLGTQLDTWYEDVQSIEDQKEFALAIASIRQKHLLFSARKLSRKPSELLMELTPDKVLECIAV